MRKQVKHARLGAKGPHHRHDCRSTGGASIFHSLGLPESAIFAASSRPAAFELFEDREAKDPTA